MVYERTKSLKLSSACLRLLLGLLGVWFIISFGCAILWRDWLDVHMPPIGHAPFGFWMAQQGLFWVLSCCSLSMRLP